jgi:hypothetical protein
MPDWTVHTLEQRGLAFEDVMRIATFLRHVLALCLPKNSATQREHSVVSRNILRNDCVTPQSA